MTDIATNLNTIDGSLSDIKTAITNKGGTVSGNITTFATAIDNIPSGGGDDEYANYIQIENIIKGTSYVEADEVEAACDDISMFLYGTLHS